MAIISIHKVILTRLGRHFSRHGVEPFTLDVLENTEQ